MRIGIYPLLGTESLRDGPWTHFVAGIESVGHSVVDIRWTDIAPEALVVFNRPRDVKELLGQWRFPVQHCALVMMEPAVSQPSLHSRSYLRLFGHVFAASRHWAREEGAVPFLWPQDITPARIEVPMTAAVSMVCANKRSAVASSLYGLRRQVIRRLQDEEGSLSLYGPGWDEPWIDYARSATRAVAKAVLSGHVPSILEAYSRVRVVRPSYRGFASDKPLAISSSPVSIVIENSPDYVSEKLVDVIRVGKIPVYVGPCLADYGLPPGVAVIADAHLDSIADGVRLALSVEGREVQRIGAEWLASPAAMTHDASFVLHTLGRDVGRAVGVAH